MKTTQVHVPFIPESMSPNPNKDSSSNESHSDCSFTSYNSTDESDRIMQATENEATPPATSSKNDATQTITIDEAVDRIGHGKFQNQILIAAGTSFMADSMEILLLSFLTLVLQYEWGWEGDNPIEIPIITAVMFAGAMAGTLLLGPLGDRIGRKPILFCAASLISIFGLGTALCLDFTTLVICRFMVGFGIGGLTVPFDILAEFLPTENRGKYLLSIEYFWTIGSMLVPVIAYLSFELFYSWQLFVVICAIPCLVSLCASIMYVPESPRWLIMKGRKEEALEILKRAAIINGVDPSSIFPEGCVIECQEVENNDCSELLKPKWRRITILLWIVWFGFAFSYYGTIMTITKIFGEAENIDGENQITFDYSAIFISSCAELVGLVLAIALVDRVGRIPSQVSSYAIGGVGLFFLCLFSHYDGSRMILITLSFIVRIVEMTGSCVTWTSTAEMLSTDIRSTGHSAANAVGRIGGLLCPFLIAGDASLINIGIVMLIIHGVTAYCASKLPETNGMELGKVTDHDGQENDELMTGISLELL